MIYLLNSSVYLLGDLLDDAGILGIPDIARRSRTLDGSAMALTLGPLSRDAKPP